MKIKTFPFLFLLFFLLPIISYSQHQGNEALGFQFATLPNWKVYETNGIYMLTSPNEAGLIVVWKNTYTNVEAIRHELSQNYQESTTALSPQGVPEGLGNHAVGVYMSGQFTGVDCRGYLIGFVLPNGKSGNIFATRTPEGFDAPYFRKLALQIANTITPLSSKNTVTAIANPLKGTGNSADLLGGYRIASISSGGSYGSGYSSKEVISFCPNGTYELYSESSFAIGGDYGMASQGDSETISGYWMFDKSSDQYTLTLTVNGKITAQKMKIAKDSYGDTQFELNGTKYGYYGRASCN